MDLVKEYKEKSNFKNEREVLAVITSVFAELFERGTIRSEYKSEHTINKKEDVNSFNVKLLEYILSNDFVTSKETKLNVVKLLDDLNYRIELLHLMNESNKSALKDLKETSERMGRKFMSSEKK
ncbi:hypothetical protein HYN56_03355 [Flavobacterium crocinum]|uniref:Uncharacterized protein n=1 Tax=Flavobacterium crocinum TaxID=2183896 RepID=A0A2S1YGX0_9FLAO|nr:hypothetical protein [Flavobacterium crocinum]AWK03307.1 hypothetical protein HYN56_03355 [Flavobacterium crocinum]